ncbi:GAP family protein [Rhodococcus sp. NPDC058514]|uniref:GAP family protein n=1 Tax=unclassified Rhodococcus (in: high G+C Gram-positive bacteria) TaxID=192944 RepID=UPI003660FF15
MTYAMGLALSPFAVTTGIVLLLGDRGRVKTSLFGLGWFLALLVITAIAMAVVDVVDDDHPEQTADGVNIVQLLFALLFFGLAIVAWVKRPSAESSNPPAAEREGKKPGILDRLDDVGIAGCFGLGLAQGVLVVKNIPLAVSAGAVLGAAALDSTQSAGAVVAFALLASAGVIVPLAVAIVAGHRMDGALASARAWIEQNMTAITLVVLLVLGAYFLGQGLAITG